MANKPLTGLSARLMADQLLEEQAIHSAEAEAAKAGISLSKYLLDEKLVGANDLMQATAEEFGLPVMDLEAFDPKTCLKKLFRKNWSKNTRFSPWLNGVPGCLLLYQIPVTIRGLMKSALIPD